MRIIIIIINLLFSDVSLSQESEIECVAEEDDRGWVGDGGVVSVAVRENT